MVINSITGKPENNQAVSFAEYNNKPLFLNTVTQTYGETKFTDESGFVEFKDINLKCREKFRYSVNLASSDVNERFFGKTVRQQINKNEDEKIYLLEIEPTISYIEIKPKVNISFQNTYFRVSAECIAISSGLSSSYYPIVLDTVSELITQVDQRYIKGKYPMGAYKIQIVRYQNTVTDTIKNRETWNKIKGDKEVIIIKDSPVLNEMKPLILKDNIVQINTIKIAEQEAKIAEEQAIQAKLVAMAKAEIAKETPIK